MDPITRRDLLKKAAAAGGAMLLAANQARAEIHGASETEGTTHGVEGRKIPSLGPTNPAMDALNPDSVVPPETDRGNIDPFRYPFSFAHKKSSQAGWARQVTIHDLGVARDLAGVNMRLMPNGCRELHWHESGEWAYMLAGKARVTCIDYDGRGFVDDVEEGDLWFFPSGVPHSIQAPAEGDGCEFLLVFDDGHFSEYETFLISEWVARTPKSVIAKSLNVPESALEHLPKEEQFIFYAAPFGALEDERKEVADGIGYAKRDFTFHLNTHKPDHENKSGSANIIDSKVFPVSTTVATAIVTVKPGGIREMHWHPNADEWQYYIKGQGRMNLFAAANRSRTMDFQAGDVGYVPTNQGHYIENTGTEDLVFLEMFKSSYYADMALAEWITHTPKALVMSHLKIDSNTYDAITRQKNVTMPAT
jgi:oxalate decarboxylase